MFKLFNLFKHKRVKSSVDSRLFLSDIMKYKAFIATNNIKTVVFGSSHGRDCFFPTGTSFNLANSSQDLYRAYKLYEFILQDEIKTKNLKNVVIIWSVFHSGLQLEKTREYLKCSPYKVLYNIDYACDLPIKDGDIILALKKYINTVKLPQGYRGESLYDIIHQDTTSELVAKHVKNTKRNNNQIQYLIKMANLAQQHNHKLFVVLPPYRSDYLKYLPPDDEIYAELFGFLNNNPNVKLLNFQRDKDFLDTDFDSADHCCLVGAKKFTKKLLKYL